MIINMKNISAISVTAFLLSSCAFLPSYEAPEISFSDTWNHVNIQAPKGTQTNDALKIKLVDDNQPAQDKPVEAEKPTDDKKAPPAKKQPEIPTFDKSEWWKNFNDPVLNQLIAEAEKSNYDIKTATSRIKEARGNRLSAVAVLFPQIDATGSASRAKTRSVFNSKPQNTAQAGFDASWELDIFGAPSKYQAADDIVEGITADHKDVIITIRAEVARNYMEVRNFQNQIKITQDNIKSQDQSLGLTRSQRNAGIVSDLDVSQAESLYFSTSSRLPLLKTSLEQAKNNLSVLLGQQPGKLDETLSKIQPVPVADKKFVIQTPATAISNRPDVRAAERNLAAANALYDAALADFFPKLSLTSFFGFYHNGLVKGGSIWSLGANAVMPLIDFGRIRGQARAASAREEQASNDFQKTVLAALAEIQTNLVAYINEESRFETLSQAVASNKKAVELSRARYDSGVAAFTDVLLAQGELYNAQSQLAQSEANVAESLIALNKSLGR